MFEYAYEVINLIDGVPEKTYLELGVADNFNFNNINCQKKFSVDTNGRATITATTDQFFDRLDQQQKFDIIYIDANHNCDYVIRDFNNSIKHCTQWVVLHDLIPPTEMHTQERYCSDAYKVLYYMITKCKLPIFTMKEPSFMGLTFVKMPLDLDFSISEKDITYDISYEDFMNYIASNYQRYSIEEIASELNEK